MTRIALGIEYQGTPYFGWQRQAKVPSVQADVERALSRVADEEIVCHCSGRTDKGVHAVEQVVHFDTQAVRPLRAWWMGSNCYLPDEIKVQWAQAVDESFHARFKALARRYLYVIRNHPARASLWGPFSAWHCNILNSELMHQAGQALIGEHDFSSFRASECQAASPVRQLQHLRVWRQNDLILVDVKANGFLHHMVRNIVGSLCVVGEGQQPPSWIESVLAQRSRAAAGVTAPAEGLYFLKAYYPDSYHLPHQIVPPFGLLLPEP